MKSMLKSAFLVLCAFAFLFTQSAAALSQTDLNALYGDWAAYVPNTGSGNCSGDGVGAVGVGSPSGATFPALADSAMADAINTWISKVNPSSRLSGLGDTIVADAKHANVSPFLLVTIARNESNLADPGVYNVIHGSNGFGRSAAPGQPSFHGARDWYKWTSVKASVDYTAPENKGAAGGGDMATYLRNVYGKNIDTNNLLAVMEAYAPPSDGNDTIGYIAKIRLWTSQLVALTANQVPPSDNNSSAAALITGSCSCSSSAATTDSKPTIVIDPGHSGLDKSVIDPATKLIDHDYPNTPEMTEAFNISQDLKTRLSSDGYNVVLTKQNVNDYVSLRQRADIANNAKADLAVSIHDDHGQNFSTFKQIYAQKVGLYRTSTTGQNVVFGDQEVANKSAAYATKFQTARQQTEGGSVSITNANFNGRAGLSPGNIPLVQLFSKVPWVYNEVGANGITGAQLKSYEDGIFKGIESSVPVNGGSGSGVSNTGCSSCTNSGSTVSGPNSAILCEAEKYNGIYYLWGGGHSGYSAFRQACPEESISSASASSTADSPGPCATDCSALVSVAVDAAYNQAYSWSVSESDGKMVGTGAENWKQIPIASAEAGDIVTRVGHVEIVVSVKNGAFTTFGSHETGVKTGQVDSLSSYWLYAWRWAGPGGAN